MTVATLVGKNSGTSLKTAPLPRPSSAAQPSAPTVNGSIDGHISSSANGTTPANTPDSTRAPPMRSASTPPTGRISGGQHDEPGGAEPGIGGRQAELVAQQRRQVDRERDEAAEGEEVEGGERPRQPLRREHADHRAETGRTDGHRRVARKVKKTAAHTAESAATV